MAERQVATLDGCFHALAHPVRRGILEHLADGPATVGEVAEPYDVAAPTISRHLGVLEEAGLVARERVGREHHLRLQGQPLFDATSWLTRYRRFWHERLDALDDLIASVDEADEEEEGEERSR